MEHRLIHVCGTNGSGKTHLVRSWMAQHEWQPLFEIARKAPSGYVSKDGRFYVQGSYNVAIAAGCDTIKDAQLNYAMIEAKWRAGMTVVYEGLFMMNHMRGIAMWRSTKAMSIIRLTTSVGDCLAAVEARRAAAGTVKEHKSSFEYQLRSTDRRAANYTSKLAALGAPVYRLSRDDAAAKLNALTSGD